MTKSPLQNKEVTQDRWSQIFLCYQMNLILFLIAFFGSDVYRQHQLFSRQLLFECPVSEIAHAKNPDKPAIVWKFSVTPLPKPCNQGL